ncbi:2Fe-2S iron-sulfur cluster-binding protein [Spongiibacter marinus]|uniref:2Fe-2S iron-sulfur cluster-binding protein n=1 Tax=Spongiibacter marinus TaxID=354246 RepID=UPI000429F372|nr:2Fe-2S iron-sulfur cluster-binding protein [Spongiibacter marinus]
MEINFRFRESDGTVKDVVANKGDILMEVAKENLIVGIDADCGGGCACGTCRIYADNDLEGVLGDPDAMESSMLDFTAEGDRPQRLSCQISVTEILQDKTIEVVV